MTDNRGLSQYSLVSTLSEELDKTHGRTDYDLNRLPPQRAPAVYSQKDPFVSEEEILLNQSEYETKRDWPDPPSSTTLARPFQVKLTRAKDFLSSYNPATAAGREQVARKILCSGPVQRVNTDLGSVLNTKTTSNHFLQGWRMGVFLSLLAVSICLVVELIMLGLAMMLNKEGGDENGIGILYVGDCAKVERITTIIGIPLNIIATVLVATSNYVMQCLSAPSRKEVDRAHASGSYLNIGISSVHNLVHNLSVKSLLWAVLVISTIPIHLFLNSAFFGSLQANNYGVMVAYEGYNITLPYMADHFYDYHIGWNGTKSTLTLDTMFTSHMGQRLLDTTNPLQLLTPDECFARYSKQLQSTASNVILVIGEQSSNFSRVRNSTNYYSHPADSPAYTLAPPFRELDDYNSYEGHPKYVDPINTFEMRSGVGLSLNPSSENAVPVFDSTYHWTSAIRPANVSGGIYYVVQNYRTFARDIPSMFTSFDYNYWTMIKEYEYNFNNTKILTAGQWNPNSWICPAKDMLAGNVCTGGSNTAPKPWLVTPEEF